MNDSQMLDVLERRAKSFNSRRQFFRTAGLLSAGAAATAAMAGSDRGGRLFAEAEAQSMTPMNDVDILNFALNLEYLEANFYSFAVTGHAIAPGLTTGMGTRGLATGGSKVPFSDPVVAAFAEELYRDELDHVKFLRTALGSAAIAQPAIDVGTAPTGSFSSAAQAAGVVAAGQSFNPYADDNNFLLGAFIFEDVGVTAYQGAAGLIKNKTYLTAASGILAIEAYHAGGIRTLIYNKGLKTHAVLGDANKISAARDSLDGASDDDQGILLSGVPNFVPTTRNSLTFPRTPGQVLNIAYLNAAVATKGGFFPNGVNGTVNESAAS